MIVLALMFVSSHISTLFYCLFSDLESLVSEAQKEIGQLLYKSHRVLQNDTYQVEPMHQQADKWLKMVSTNTCRLKNSVKTHAD